MTSKLNATKMSNGRQMHDWPIDGRSKSARRWKFLHDSFCQQLGVDPSELDETTKGLIRRACSLSLELERADHATASGEPLPQAYSNWSAELARTLKRLRLLDEPSPSKPEVRRWR